MNDKELDTLLARTAISEEAVARLDLRTSEAELLEAIVASERPKAETSGRSLALSNGSRRRYRRVPTIGVAAAALALVAAVALQPFGGGGGAWADVLVEAAESSPLLLVAEPGWEVVRADVYGEEGEMRFAGDGRELDLHWRDPDSHEAFVEDRAASADHREELTVLGRDATLSRYAGTANDVTTIFSVGAHTIEVRGTFATIEDYKRVLLSLERVDVDTWLDAMPDSVIAAAERAPVVRGMLEGIPLPDGLDVAALETGTLADRYQLGAEVTGAVACGWIEQWIAGKASGDTDAVDEATSAMSTSPEWAVLQEMTEEGAWPDMVWVYADAMAGDGMVPGGSELTIEEDYRNALGCDRYIR